MSRIPRFVSRILVIALLLPIAAATTSPPLNDVASAAEAGHEHGLVAAGLTALPIQGQVVTGTLTLTGTNKLTEDLIVDGGILKAGAGVVIDGGGQFQIMVMNEGKLDWNGVTAKNLTRIMFHMGAGASEIRNTEVINSGKTGELGFYPLHWHFNRGSTEGTIVENVTVRGGKNHAFVPHASHGITFRNIKAFNTVDDAFWWDPPENEDDTSNNSNDIKIYNALIDGVTPKPGDDGLQLTAFQLGAGDGNEIHDSVAKNVGGRKNCAAFHWPEDANHNFGGNEWVFENNIGTSECHGIFVWQNDGGDHIIRNFKGGGISHGAYDTPGYRYINPDVPYFEAHAVGFVVRGGSVGRVIGASGRFEGNATFVDTEVTSLRINNNTDKPAPVHYIFENTGLRCSDVTWGDVKPGTTVRIDGRLCGSGSQGPIGTFSDDDGSLFEGAIEAIAAKGITQGCNPPANDRFCPNDEVTRGQMAVFLARAFNYNSASTRDRFADDDGEFYENAANKIRAAGVSEGCNPPDNDEFCGEESVTRGQMAAFIVRAKGLTNDGEGDLFDDDDTSVFESAIDRLGTAGITAGCNPPDNDEFCPNDHVTRGQMAAFLARALGLKPISPSSGD